MFLSLLLGGITPDTAPAWFENGAVAVGMGSKLVGKDIRTDKAAKEFSSDAAEWVQSGRKVAAELFKKLSNNSHWKDAPRELCTLMGITSSAAINSRLEVVLNKLCEYAACASKSHSELFPPISQSFKDFDSASEDNYATVNKQELWYYYYKATLMAASNAYFVGCKKIHLFEPKKLHKKKNATGNKSLQT